MKSIGTFLWDLIEKIAIFCLGILFKIIHKELTDEIKESFMQFVAFGIVGVINTILSYLINIGVLLILKPYGVSWDYVAGNITAFVITVFISFLLNGTFVFKKEEGQKRSFWKTLLRTYIAYSFTGIILTNVLSFVWINVFGISKFIAPLINLIVSVPINFVMNKLWAYKPETVET